MIVGSNGVNYRMVDFQSWKRADRFKYFLNVEKCIITVTAHVDVQDFVAGCKKHDLKFYTAFICLISYVLNQKECFRFGYNKDGDVVIYECIKPFYTDSVSDDGSFNCIVTDYCPDMKRMYENVSADRERYKNVDTLFPDNMSDNIFSITALPAVHYTQLELNDASNPDSLAPAIAVGKYEFHEGRLMMPLTLWIHHAVCDGSHVGQFFADTQRLMPETINQIINKESDRRESKR